jgi:hypothetical protein
MGGVVHRRRRLHGECGLRLGQHVARKTSGRDGSGPYGGADQEFAASVVVCAHDQILPTSYRGDPSIGSIFDPTVGEIIRCFCSVR